MEKSIVILYNKNGDKMKKYLRMNNNDRYLSLGNLFRIVKEISINTSNSVQTEIFCILFDIDNINTTTVNNYCVGSRSIGNIYKQKCITLKKNYLKNKDIYYNNCVNLINLMDGINHVVNSEIDVFINQSNLFILLISKLVSIMKNDHNINNDFINKVNVFISNNDYYSAFVEMFLYAVLENKQPLNTEDQIKETINDLIEKTNISVNDIQDILEIELKEGLSYYGRIKALADKDNPYALYKLARMEYRGEVTGKKNIDKCITYLKKAIKFNHPASLWMMAHLILKKEISQDIDYNLVWNYLDKAYQFGSVAALNTMGICYMNGWTTNGKKDTNKALECLMEASRYNYVYSYNNLGKYYEQNNDNEKAFYYYKLSANNKNSWACNKIGEVYRKKVNLKEAYNYYINGIDTSKDEVCYYNYYNLAKYYYLFGCSELMLLPNVDLAINYLEKCVNEIFDAKLLLFYVLISKYKEEPNDFLKKEIYSLKEQIELSKEYNDDIKKEIEDNLSKIKKLQSINLILD